MKQLEQTIENCAKCLKRPTLCICDAIVPVKNKFFVMILQHPQEPDKDLGTAKMTTLALSKSALKIGLSWPNQMAAFKGTEAPLAHSPKHWGVLYLGSARVPDGKRAEIPEGAPAALVALDRKGKILGNSKDIVDGLAGIVVLDGTWSQAKTLWWRNAWLLKMHRLALFPRRPSLYGKLRKEPRRECLSTIETAAFALAAMEERTDMVAPLTQPFSTLLDRMRKPKKQAPVAPAAAHTVLATEPAEPALVD